MLSVKDLCVSYGAINALKGISFEVNEGEIISLIGSNGAGKTTTLHAVSNIIKKKSGAVEFDGTDITQMNPDLIVKKNLIQIPEGRRIFQNLTVKENLEMRAAAEQGACEGKLMLAKRAKELGFDAIHDTVHEMAKDEARHGRGFDGLLKRYFN